MARRLLIPLLCSLALAAPAQAATVSPAESELMASTSIVRAPCPTITDRVLPCADQDDRTIYLPSSVGTGPLYRVLLWHERGHVVDYWLIDEAERGQIAAALGWSAWAPERFADSYASCHVSERTRERASRGRNYHPLPRRSPCALIASAAS